MKIIVLFALLGVCLATPVPQNWPYGNSPYYYGYPGKTQYVYRASIEDDEEPIDRSRQDQGQSVTTLINNAALKQQEQINNFGNEKPQSVVETGSVAPVQDRPVDASSVANSKDQSKVSTNGQSPNVVKPGVVNPPPFPPKRVPKPTSSKKPDEDDSDEEDEDEEDEDVSAQDENEDDDDQEEEEEEEEEARRRNEPIDVSADAVALPVPENATSIESVEVTPVPSATAKPDKPVVESDKENAVVDTPIDEESSDENSSYEGVEAFVPGYVTDQGEVLVPVDTVTGDQPISIVPDPYTPPARGVPVNYYNYRAGLQNSAVPVPGRVYRQGDIDDDDDDASAAVEDEPVEDEEDEDVGGGPYDGPFEDESDEEEEEEDDADSKKKKKKTQKPPLAFIPATAPTNEDDELESALRYRAESFPPSRSPVLLPVTFRINGGYLTGPFKQPVSSSEVFQFVSPEVRYAVQKRTQPPRPNIFTPYMGSNNYEQQLTMSKPVMTPFTYIYRPASAVSNRPKTPFYVRTQPAPSTSYYMPSMYYPQQQQGMPVQSFYPQTTTKLHNPGEKLKIKSSYELSVEPSKESVSYKTKSRPNKKRVNTKKRPSTKTSSATPVRVVPLPAKKPSGSVVLKRPIYGMQGQRVQIRPASSPYYVGNVKPYYVGNRYGGAPVSFVPFRPYRQPTPVIYQDEPAEDSSAASDEPAVPVPGPEGRQRKWKREMKKPVATKKLSSNKKPAKADRLGLFVAKPMKTNKSSRRSTMA